MNEKSKIRVIEKKYLVFICLIILIIIMSALHLNRYPHEISNNVTLAVEIGVGTIIAIIVYGISRKSEIEIEKKVNSVSNIVEEGALFKKKQVEYIEKRLLDVFINMRIDAIQVLKDSEKYNKLENHSAAHLLQTDIVLGCNHIRNLAEKNLDDLDKIFHEFIEFNTIQTFKTISSVCKNEPQFSEDGMTVNVSFCMNIKNMIEPFIDDLHKKWGIEEIQVSESPKLEADTKILALSTSSDRTVYPLDSTIHVRANLPYVIKGEKITYEIFNSKRKLLLSQQIDPEKYDNPDLRDSNIFEVSFKMEGEDWKVGQTYIVRATHGSSYSEDSFFIDQRMPVVQSDKSVYIINHDMILTVIDPDGDKDNDVAEFVGDREDSKLIIESPYGKIEGYKLRETGDSTGIFQGIIGILGIRQDRSVIPREVDGKIIDKIQGTGISDGFIGGKPGDEMTISYKNKTGTAHLSVFISNFGALVEMDQKVYKPDDKVYLTIVAPDFNLDSEKTDEIGQKPEGLIQIRTSIDELSNYKLVETGPDTGIFTGELQLTESLEKSSSRSQNKFGPADGCIACNKDDFIEVTFNMFGSDQVVGSALIKSWNY